MQLKSLDIKGLFFITLLLGLTLVMLKIFSPFLDIIIVALVIVQIFYPLYQGIHKRVKINALASIITTTLSFLLVIIPIIIISFLAVFEISGVINSLPQQPQITSVVLGANTRATISEEAVTDEINAETFTQLELSINEFLTGLDNNLADAGVDLKELLISAHIVEDDGGELLRVDINSSVIQLLGVVEDRLAPALTGLVSGGLNVIFFGFLLIVTLLYMFSEYENLPNVISRISPLEDDLDRLLFKKFTDTNRAVILGSFLVAISQATAVSLLMIILGIGAPILLWLVMVILSLVPIGSGLVWLPAGLILIITGRPLEGIFLIVYSAVVINIIDTYLRPKIMKNKVQLHPLVIIFSALGGLNLFGPLGILYGPVIAVFFTSLMEIYVERYSTESHRKTHR